MEQLTTVEGVAAPILRINIDTDQITPGKELVRMRSEGAAPSLFAYWRYIGDREPNPEFILNREPWNKAKILLADRNFGCGSSRESAPQALRAWGFRAVIAPSFGGIFYNNSFRNGLLPIEMPIEDIRKIAAQMEAAQGNAADHPVLLVDFLSIEEATELVCFVIAGNGGSQTHPKPFGASTLYASPRARPCAFSAMAVVPLRRRAVEADLQRDALARQ